MVYDVPDPVPVQKVGTFARLWALYSGESPETDTIHLVPRAYWAGGSRLIPIRVAPTRAVLSFPAKPTMPQVEAWVERFHEQEGHYPCSVLICGSDEGTHGEGPGYGLLLLGEK
jgi:hypothetical protein